MNRSPLPFNRYYDESGLKVLSRYINTGEMIRSKEAEFQDSILYHLEQFIQRRRDAVIDYLGPNCFEDEEDNLDNAYFSLAAPSLEGKTQSAFVFRKVRPLYFVLCSGPCSDGIGDQRIYAQFRF